MELEEALENPGGPHDRSKTREGRPCPRRHSAQEANNPTLHNPRCLPWSQACPPGTHQGPGLCSSMGCPTGKHGFCFL